MENNTGLTITLDGVTLVTIGWFWLVFSIIFYILEVIAFWKIFKKAGRHGWESLIPIWNVIAIYQISGMSGWWVIALIVPILNVVVALWQLLMLAERFNKGVGFTVGLLLLNPIFMMILGFGESKYHKAR